MSGHGKKESTTTPHASLSAETLQAWLATEYLARLPDREHRIRIGCRHPHLDADLVHRAWYILTPYNPGGQPLDDAENRSRLAEMNMRLTRMNATPWPAENHAADGLWPVEYGFLVTGIRAAEVIDLAREFGQYGIVAGRANDAAELWLLEAGAGTATDLAVRTLRHG